LRLLKVLYEEILLWLFSQIIGSGRPKRCSYKLGVVVA